MLYSVDCSGDSKVLTELGSNKIEVIVLDDQKSRELRRIYLYDVVNKYSRMRRWRNEEQIVEK